MIKILIIFSVVLWINFVVCQIPNIECNMKTDENMDECIKNGKNQFLETKNTKWTNVKFTLTSNTITKLPETLTDECNHPNGICSYITVNHNTNLKLNDTLNVTFLKLLNTPIDIPENKPLLNTTKMIQLELINCSIHELYDETFSKLPNLELLFLDNIALKKLPQNVFKRNNNLQTVNLQNNHLSTISDGLFSNNTRLKTVYLQNNSLSVIPEGLFSNNSQLQNVYLQNNNLSTVPEGLFSNNSQLQNVSLENNNLKSLPNELFTKNTNLMTVNLTNNNLTEIVVYYNKNLTVHILNQTLNISELCKDVNSTEVRINFTDSENPYCTMFEKVEHTSTTTATINTTTNLTENDVTEFKKYAWLYFFSIILFQLIILIILMVLYIRDKDDVSQKID